MIHREWIKEIRNTAPRIHCITNYVTAGDVANMILAVGGSPIMAQGIREVEDVTTICQGLVLNMGTLEEERVDAMILAGKRAASLGHPIILDPVGVTASGFRRASALRILRQVPVCVIRGNASEICALDQAFGGMDRGNVCGVDSCTDSVMDGQVSSALSLGRRTGAVVVMTGSVDVVAGQHQVVTVRNGHPWMARITGSGCMLDGVMGAFCAVAARYEDKGPAEGGDPVEDGGTAEGGTIGRNGGDAYVQAAVAALCAHGICGELAAEKAMESGGGTGTFRMYLMDYMSILTDEMLEGGKRIEIT